ncbi:unnamed protein product [Adineta steineri]|uniref:BTB domain-containing protein n=1 Tax=Adineta steineri TaxID=433720 RepID=A0A814M6U7_9BILA|nr:unnamed protein product [Adineta steineri]
MNSHTNIDQNQSSNMNDDTVQSSLSKQNNPGYKMHRLKHNISKRRNSAPISLNHRRTSINKILPRNGESLIHVAPHDHRLTSEKNKINKQRNIITINVSGNRYQTHLSTLENYPNTLLGNKRKRKYYWNEEKNEYFFDRHRDCFEAILYYYQSNGRLRRPDYVPLDTFLEEVSFFDLGQHAISQINKLENVSIVKYIDLPNLAWRRYIWFYLEYPQHSLVAKILYFLSMLLTILSSIELAVESLPSYDDKWNSRCAKEENTTILTTEHPICYAIFSSPFFIIQTICVSYFTIEFLLRLISTPSYYKFVISIVNWIDLGAIVPYYIFIGLVLAGKETDLNGNSFAGLRIFRILRFLRIFKIYLIFRQLKSLRVLSTTLKESFVDFIIMIVILTTMGFLFGAATYYVEQDVNGLVFDSIPKATYWGIQTITTVGYGDMYPITATGRVFGCACAFFGVATSSILVSVLVDRYQRIYNRRKYFPEQILSVVESSDNEHEEKQDFINTRLSGTKRSIFSGILAPLRPVPSVTSMTKYRRYFDPKISSANIQFIISIQDNKTNNKSTQQTANELMKELTELIQNSGEQIYLKLTTSEIDSSDHQIPTEVELNSIPEE